MKKLFIVGLLFTFMFTIVNAQTKKQVFLNAQTTMDAIGLNKEQQTQITKLTNQSFADINKLQKDTTLTKFDRNSKIYEVYRNREAAYNKVLTAEQQEKFKALKAEAAKN